jgi:hypothetical protein
VGVSKDAVFVWGLPVAFPAPKRGDWVSCGFDSNVSQDICRVVGMDGTLTYQGIFLPYLSERALHDDQLTINAKLTNLAQERVGVDPAVLESSRSGRCWVTLLYLHDGDVLIPARSYAEGRKRLKELQAANSPYAPAAKSPLSPN